jgi:hypothetical protein
MGFEGLNKLSNVHWLLYLPLSISSKNLFFCPHSVNKYFLWISEQTVIISIYDINWLVFITETENVYCAVRTGYLKIIQINFPLEHVHKINGFFYLFCILFNHSRSVVHVFSQISPVCSLPNYFFKTHFNIIFTLTPTTLKFSLPFRIPTKTSHEFFISINSPYLFARSPSIFGVQIMDVLFMHFFKNSY